MNESDFELVEGSGNVFRDFDDPLADLKQAKAILASRIIAVLDDRGLSVRKAAALTRFAAADFSRIRNADLKEEHFLFIGAGDELGVSRKASLRAGDQKMVWTEPQARPWLWALHGGPRICSVAGWAQEGRMGLC